MKEFKVEFHLADSEYLTALRLVTGAVCSAHDIDLDTLEDFKVCVTESAIILKNCGFERALVKFYSCDKVCCEICGEGGSPRAGENELSLALISALVGECDISRRGEIIEGVTLKI
ncbi:MAG: ATP-binding protein [Clostridia bacterium]|nr:ATP-binding protein [Clostridia bacterium]